MTFLHDRDGFQLEVGRWVLSCFWGHWQWIKRLPLVRRGRPDGVFWVVGPFRIGAFGKGAS